MMKSCSKAALLPIILTLFLLTSVTLYFYDSLCFPFSLKSEKIKNHGHHQELSPPLETTTASSINESTLLPSPYPNSSSFSSTPSPPPPPNVLLNYTPKLQALDPNVSNSSPGKRCNIFKGDWEFSKTKEPYYTNDTKCVIDDRQNCMKFGRPDTDFLRWRWKPYGCELPLFDSWRFLEIVRGKTLAFLGDSVGRNQMQSLVCLLANAAQPVDVSYTSDIRDQRWLYKDYNFTMVAFWSPVLVNSSDASAGGNKYLMNLYLDQPDWLWLTQVENVDILIISGGQWFFRPFIYYNQTEIIGCYLCNDYTIKQEPSYFGYRMAFRTTFRTLVGLKNYKGLTFLRTFSPAHFENGDWEAGGDCLRKVPFSKTEKKLDLINLDMYNIQLEEFRDAEKMGRERGLRFRLLDTTEAMILRGDGHPSNYGHRPSQNKTAADCVHWCMPGPVDTLNEFLFQMLSMEDIV